MTAAHLTVTLDEQIVTYLLEIGADLMYKTSKRIAVDGTGLLGLKTSSDKSNCGVNTPLHWACYKGHLGALTILLHAGYSIEDVDPMGNRCLHLACSGGHRDVVELLLANSAVVDQRNQYGNRPVDLATDVACRKLLLKFQSQSTCEWCKETFTRIRRPSLCQHCHNIYCDARPCSSYAESSSSVAGGSGKAMRFCQECANEMGKAEQDLRSLLESKLELIRHTLSLLDSNADASLRSGSGSARLSGDSSRPGSSISLPGASDEAAPNASEEATTKEGGGGEASAAASAPAASDSSLSAGSPAEFGGDTPGSADVENKVDRDSESGAGVAFSTSSLKTARTRLLTSEEMARALSLSQTDAEALYTAIEAAQAKAADQELIQVAKRTYHQLVAHVTLQEEIKSLMVVRPIGIRSLVESLKSALLLAQREKVSESMLQLAVQVIQGAEAECTLFGCNALCEKIALGSKKFSKDIARLEASIAEAQLLGANDKLLASAVALRDRLNAEIMLEECLLPFSAKPGVSPETGAEITTYLFVDGTLALSLLQALELQSQKITSAVVRRRYAGGGADADELTGDAEVGSCCRSWAGRSRACRRGCWRRVRACSSSSRRTSARR